MSHEALGPALVDCERISIKMLSEWRIKTTSIPIYKNKRDIQNYTNYCEIKLMSHTIKLQKKVIEYRLRHETTILENQFSLCQ